MKRLLSLLVMVTMLVGTSMPAVAKTGGVVAQKNTKNTVQLPTFEQQKTVALQNIDTMQAAINDAQVLLAVSQNLVFSEESVTAAQEYFLALETELAVYEEAVLAAQNQVDLTTARITFLQWTVENQAVQGAVEVLQAFYDDLQASGMTYEDLIAAMNDVIAVEEQVIDGLYVAAATYTQLGLDTTALYALLAQADALVLEAYAAVAEAEVAAQTADAALAAAQTSPSVESVAYAIQTSVVATEKMNTAAMKVEELTVATEAAVTEAELLAYLTSVEALYVTVQTEEMLVQGLYATAATYDRLGLDTTELYALLAEAGVLVSQAYTDVAYAETNPSQENLVTATTTVEALTAKVTEATVEAASLLPSGPSRN